MSMLAAQETISAQCLQCWPTLMADIAFQVGNRSVMQYTRFLECEWAGQYLVIRVSAVCMDKDHGTGFDCIVIVAYQLHVHNTTCNV